MLLKIRAKGVLGGSVEKYASQERVSLTCFLPTSNSNIFPYNVNKHNSFY
jgi:hypothetical protein